MRIRGERKKRAAKKMFHVEQAGNRPGTGYLIGKRVTIQPIHSSSAACARAHAHTPRPRHARATLSAAAKPKAGAPPCRARTLINPSCPQPEFF
jgi:hypothetical protein